MGLYPDDWTLKYKQTREGELYREKHRLQTELDDLRSRERREDWEREQQEYRRKEREEQEREQRVEMMGNALRVIERKEEEIEYLKLCIKFGIEEVQP